MVHFARIAGIVAFIVLCIIYPYLPGKYDGLAVPLSTMAQVFGAVGLLLVPIGVLWLVYELENRARRREGLPSAARRYYFALASLIAASIVAMFVSLVALMVVGISLCFLTLGLWSYAASRLIRRLKLLRNKEGEGFNPAPVYLIVVPVAVLVVQLTLAGPVAEFSRKCAIKNSAELINEIERHRTLHGRYPSSLLAVWPDYYPSVAGIEKFRYAPTDNAYSLVFEQPRFLFDKIGTREFVMYNKLDEHVMPSHAAWILLWSAQQLAANQGWYEVRDASRPHWKCFLFD